MIEAVVFDFDGTLIQLPIDYERLFQEFGKILKTANVHPLTKKISGLDEKTKKRIFEVWDKAELATLTNVTANNKGISLYKKFSKKPKVLVTMQGKALVQNVLETLGLSFDFVVTREYCLDRTEQLRIAAEKLGAPIKNVLFIGNTDEDFFAAKKIGCKFVRVKG